MFILSLAKQINRNLIRQFDQSRFTYALLIFPAYQLLATVGLLSCIHLFKAIEISLFFLPLGASMAVLIGIPLLASWHLSCLLLAACYFGPMAKLGIPFMSWVLRQLDAAIRWFRPT